MTQTFESDILQRIGNQNANNDLNAISAVIAQKMGFTLNQTAFQDENFGSKLMYYPTEDGKLNLSWIIHLRIMEDGQLKIMEVIANAQTVKSIQNSTSCSAANLRMIHLTIR